MYNVFAAAIRENSRNGGMRSRIEVMYRVRERDSMFDLLGVRRLWCDMRISVEGRRL